MHPLLVFNVLRLGLSLYLARLYQMTHQLKSYPPSDPESSTCFLYIASHPRTLEQANFSGTSFGTPQFLI
jgi:hypothetical protein